MDLQEAVRARRMCRDFLPDPLSRDVVGSILDAASRAPSAGWSQAAEFLVLDEPEQTERFWDRSFPDGRSSFRWQGLFDAPVLVIPVTRPEAYTERYSEPDKATTGLGESIDAWPVPYWFVDAGMAVENLLLAAADAGLGALFFGMFRAEQEILDEFGVPAGWRPAGVVALGRPRRYEPSRSADRGRRPVEDLTHRGSW